MRTRRVAAGFLSVVVVLALVAQAAADEGEDASERRYVRGTLAGNELFGENCAWLVDRGGDAWEVLWPAGYRIEFRSTRVPVLIGPDGDVVARAGDRVGLIGAVPTGIGSRCAVGRVFDASRLVLVTQVREGTGACFARVSWKRWLVDVIESQRTGTDTTARYNWGSWRWPDGRGRCLGGA